MEWLPLVLLGVGTGLRAMTPMAVLCWFAYLHSLPLMGWRSFAASTIALVLFTLAAIGELVGDKLPKTPSRIAPTGLIPRLVLGGFVAVVASGVTSPAIAAAFGAVGALAGSFGGWFVRTRAVRALGCPDWMIAVPEDLVAIVGTALVISKLIAV